MAERPEQQDLLGNWIWHRDAAAMMGVNEKTLREKDRRGYFLYWPQLDRIQPVERGRIYLRRDQIAAWRAQREQEAAQNKPPEFREPSANPFESMREEFAQYPKLLRQLGVQL